MPVSVIYLECLSLYLAVFVCVCVSVVCMIAYMRAHAEVTTCVHYYMRVCVFLCCVCVGCIPSFNLVFEPLIIPPFTNWKIAN